MKTTTNILAMPRTWTPEGNRRDLVGVVDGKVIPLLTDQDEAYLLQYAEQHSGRLENFYQLIAITPKGYYRHGETFKGYEPIS